MAYDTIDPITKERDDYGWAMICSVVTNLVRDLFKKKGTSPKMTTPIDFIPEWGAPAGKRKQPVQSIEEQKRILLGIANRHNRMIERQKNG